MSKQIFKYILGSLVAFATATSLASSSYGDMTYVEAAQNIIRAMDLDGAREATPVGIDVYNKDPRKSDHYILDVYVPFIPETLYYTVLDSRVCDIDLAGGCFVVERDIKNNPTAYYLGVVYESKEVVEAYKKPVDMNRFPAEVQLILDYAEQDNGEPFELISQVQPGQNLERDHMDRLSRRKWERIKEENRKQDDAEKALIRCAINEGEFCEGGPTVDEDMLMRHLQVYVPKTDADVQKAEEEMRRYFVGSGRNWKTHTANRRRLSQKHPEKLICFAGGKFTEVRERYFPIHLGILKRDKRKPQLKGKGKLNCYAGGKLRQSINTEIKMFSEFGLGVRLPVGEFYAGAVAIGDTKRGPVAYLTDRQKDGSLKPFREWAYPLGANFDLGYIFGVGFNLVGISGGIGENPALSLGSGRVGVGVVSFTWDMISVGRMGLDPDDF